MITSGVGGLLDDVWHGVAVRRYPTAAATLVDNLDRGRRLWPDRSLVVDDGSGTTTYAEFAELVEGAARHLRDGLRLEPGDRVAVALPNGLDIAVAIWACARAHLVFVGLPTRLAPDSWAYLLQHSRAAVLLSAPEHLAASREAAAAAGLDAVHEVADHLVGHRSPWPDDLTEGPWPVPPEDETYAVIYTSGTTGRPKAIRMTHRGTMQAAEHYVRALGLTETDRTAVTFSFHYLSGHVTQMNPAMLSGGSVVPVRELHPRAVVELCERHDVTWLDIVPSLLALLAKVAAFAWPQLPRLRLAVYGGSPMLPGVVEVLRERMPQMRLVDTLGMTETAVAFCCLYDHEIERRRGSVGRPIPTADLRLVDDDGADVPAGGTGELLVRGPFLTPGYDADDEAKARAFTDGWFHTGDVARIDDEGYVYVLDRKKDMIIRGGNKVFSVEVEQLLGRLDEVGEVAVFGVPDRTGGEVVAAVVVPSPGAEVDPQALRRHVREHLADYAVPRHVDVVEEIPRNRTGKVDKLALRNGFSAAARSD
ncbi:MAG TPA: AMP-binding protein [Actinomycetales bacterium]|nr:AMP-binding protein [Actinomycetales bacterium]